MRTIRYLGAIVCFLAGLISARADTTTARAEIPAFVDRFCHGCHNPEKKKGDLNLEPILPQQIEAHSATWEKVVRKLRARQMPPPDWKRPDEKAYTETLSLLEGILDAAAQQSPNPGRTDTFRRLNRTEYQNAIRDLLALEIDPAALLPKDEASHGFDNVTVADLSPTLLDRYISAAQKISRLAIGASARSHAGDTIRIRPDLTQEEHVDGLPLGTRGGALIPYTFPLDGEYEIQIRLARDRNEDVEGLREPHQLELLLDKTPIQSFTVAPPRGELTHEAVDKHLKARLRVKAGPHQIGVTFVKNPSSLLETKRQPYNAHFNMHRHPRLTPALYQVSINGPFNPAGPGDTPSRRQVFVAKLSSNQDETQAASQIVSNLMRRAYRRPVQPEDLEKPMQFYRQAAREGGFEAGIETALSAILVSPHFLFRVERDPAGSQPGAVYRLSDVELASRLSFFLWSSIPDGELLEVASRGELSSPEMLAKQARRLLADPRSRALARNFAGQWLHLRNLDSFTPDLRLFPDFDDNLRQAFRQETELLFETVAREDRGIQHLLKSEHTFLNERLARHYGIPHILGGRFRQVSLSPESRRGGMLRHGSILAVTSYATRTSPVIRGNWILANIIGTPPPPPPPNVPALQETTIAASLPIRQRLAEHRANAACASCHDLMDPVGFSLENYDAVGRWRETEEGIPVDAAGGLPDGAEFTGVDGLEQGLIARPELFAQTLAEKLLTFALGRGIEPSDAPAIRKIVRHAQAQDFRFSALITGIVQSDPFTKRRAR